MERLRKRAEFVTVAKGRRIERAGFVIQGRRRPHGPGQNEDAPARFGFTVTKKIGNSVIRNRIRRRLREAVRRSAAAHASRGTDYVLLARPDALTLPFDRLVAELSDGIDRLNVILTSPRGARDGHPRRGRGQDARTGGTADTIDAK